MAELNWHDVFESVLGSEGGFQNDPNDKGNWTGCAVGAGQNKGTKYGISACSYPQIDIRNLTQQKAGEIYRADYWNSVRGDDLPWGVDLCTFDSAVNSGVSRGAKWLQRAVVLPADGVVGNATVLAAQAMDPHVVIDRMCDDRMDYLKTLPTWRLYGEGWTTRVRRVRAEAHEMAIQHEGEPVRPVPMPVPAPVVAEIVEIIVRKPAGSAVRIVIREEEA